MLSNQWKSNIIDPTAVEIALLVGSEIAIGFSHGGDSDAIFY